MSKANPLPQMSYRTRTAIRKTQTNEGVIASRCDSALGRKATEPVLTDTLNPTEFLPSVSRRGGERLYDLVDNISPEAGDIVRKAGREVGLDLSGRRWNWNEQIFGNWNGKNWKKESHT